MFCLVTGVAGFVGSSIAEELLSRGFRVRGVDCFTDYYPRKIKENNLRICLNNPNFSFIEGDLTNCDLKLILKDVEWLFHQAAQAGVRASWGRNFASYCQNNILASQYILEEAKGSSTLKKLVFASSSSIYGDAERYPTPETTIPSPISPYGVTKLASEHLMCLYATQFNVPTVSLRYFTVFGPRQRPDMGFHKFIKAALENKPVQVYGNGEQSRDFTYISDIVEANILAAEKGGSGDVINIGGGTRSTVNQVLDIMRSIIGDIHVEQIGRMEGDAKHTSADTSLAKSKLGFTPKVNLRDGIANQVEWLKKFY